MRLQPGRDLQRWGLDFQKIALVEEASDGGDDAGARFENGTAGGEAFAIPPSGRHVDIAA